MAPHALAPLAELIHGYPASGPTTMTDLLATDFGFLDELDATPDQIELVKQFRRELIGAVRATEAKAITSAEVALAELTNRRIRPVAFRWLTLALDADRKRRLVPKSHDPGAMHYASHISDRVPTATELAAKIPLPDNGRYLVIYGQSPEILSKDPVADAVDRLLTQAPVADVLFWHLVGGSPPTLYSLRKGAGDQGGKRVEFPDPDALARAHRSTGRSPASSHSNPSTGPDIAPVHNS